MLIKRLLTSCFGLGWLPLVPGTWGSIPPALIWMLLSAGQIKPAIITAIMIVFTLSGSAVCVVCTPAISRLSGKTDPNEIVSDEFAGQSLVFLLAGSFISDHVYITAFAGFFVFRVFDTLKPWPINAVEQLAAGWGVLADDLLAAVLTAVVLILFNFAGLFDKAAGFFTAG